MNIAITFRHMQATDAVKAFATEKVGRLQKFLRQPMKGQVTLSSQNHLHTAEVDVQAGGEHYHAHETREDMYASIDLVVDKLERQITNVKETTASRRKGAPRAADVLPIENEEAPKE